MVNKVVCPKAGICKEKGIKGKIGFCQCSVPHKYDPVWCAFESLNPECPACVTNKKENINA